MSVKGITSGCGAFFAFWGAVCGALVERNNRVNMSRTRSTIHFTIYAYRKAQPVVPQGGAIHGYLQ